MHAQHNAKTRNRPARPTTLGQWWRFSSYKLDRGWIVPAAGSELVWYDPWDAFKGSRGITIGQAPHQAQPIYASLMSLVSRIQFHPGVRRYPDCVTLESQKLILEWCQQYGPLGILLSRWEALRLAPQGSEADLWSEIRYSRGSGLSVQVNTLTGDVRNHKPVALMRGLDDLDVNIETPAKTWARFFPSVPITDLERFQYPEPYTDDFCHHYAERLSDFCSAATLLAGAMQQLGRTPPPAPEPEEARTRAVEILNLLRRPVDSILDFDENKQPFVRWVASSLIASFAEMFVQDLVFGLATLLCKCCGLPFVSGAYQSLYCSLACRLKQQKRNLRRQMKEAIALRAQGKGIREIALALDQTPKTIKGWLAKARTKTRKTRPSTRVQRGNSRVK